MSALDDVCYYYRSDEKKSWGEWMKIFDSARAELAALRAKAARCDQLQEGMSEMRAAIESEYATSLQQLTEALDRTFDDVAYLRAAAEERDRLQERIAALETKIEKYEGTRLVRYTKQLEQHVKALRGAVEHSHKWLERVESGDSNFGLDHELGEHKDCDLCAAWLAAHAPAVTPEQFERTAPVDWREAQQGDG